MTQYQSFPGVKGASESLAKLEALRLPPLQGKRFLDVGCNEGFFCGYARFDGAAEVIGIDASKATIARAQARFPDCRFLARPGTNCRRAGLTSSCWRRRCTMRRIRRRSFIA
jgi:SAM-dependent methyltransferase